MINLKKNFFSRYDDSKNGTGLASAKAAFSLMGFSFSEHVNNQSQSLTDAEVFYRKKNIRLQNKYLKFKLPRNDLLSVNGGSSHIYFDDDGNPCSKISNEVNILFLKRF